MALPGETVGVNGVRCDCGKWLEFKSLASPAGYYLGYRCDQCGPYSRETVYFRDKATAELVRQNPSLLKEALR